MSDQKTAYPLCWPEAWPRTLLMNRRASAFGGAHYNRPSMEKSVDFLVHEVRLLRGSEGILSTNVKRRLDGAPNSNQPQPADVGAALYFDLKSKPIVLACDKWNRVECNVFAIAKHIEAIRGQSRWGVGNVEQAFYGYTALPAPGQTGGLNPWLVLGLAVNCTEEQLSEAYRRLAKKYHPDNPETGDPEAWHTIREAYDMISQNLNHQP